MENNKNFDVVIIKDICGRISKHPETKKIISSLDEKTLDRFFRASRVYLNINSKELSFEDRNI